MKQGNNERNDGRPIVDEKTTYDSYYKRAYDAFLSNLSRVTFRAFFFGSLIGSILGSAIVKILTKLL